MRADFLLCLSFSSSLASATTCYLYGGQAIDSAYQPCNGTAPVSMCCHLGVSNNNGDACGSGSTYGLCGVTGTQLWRESCTDQTWQSPSCLKLCTTGAGATGDSMITACDDGSYCCGQNNATCCDAGQGMFIVDNEVSLTKSTSSSSSASSTATSLPSTSSSSTSAPIAASSTGTPSPMPTNSTSSGMTTGAKVGIAVGVTGGVLAIAAGLVFLFMRRRKDTGLPTEPMADYQTVYNPTKVVSEPTTEMDANRNTQELDGYYRGQELHGKSVAVQQYAEMPT
ncbi:uncharacterized protein LY89DRAFT_273028 [Mollisia scopiformis]|uniref:Mid2 domain-containing protein n=1 Tax=Mollisia scopiformis TaxID=149040 RepID=A0A132BCI1_MOLSC|nr:uncharacterized protein LY89DRAFT_273028 [Mollisia scopiformis]KUJ09564.1 hypothetical protein LY89DRAFT_273028 [Mollisia scopiformis]